MTTPQTFNVYCDESCHLEHDGVPVMAWGAVTCEALEVRAIAEVYAPIPTRAADQMGSRHVRFQGAAFLS
jgi:hypothetical protein